MTHWSRGENEITWVWKISTLLGFIPQQGDKSLKVRPVKFKKSVLF